MTLQNKNVLVTGGAGFIGSTLVREILKEKANIVVYDNFLSGHMSNLEEIKDRIKVVEGDVRDEKIRDVMKENNIEYVFNLAAHPYIPECYEKPLEFFDVDATGALNVMLACRDLGVKRMIQYSTSEVYGTAKNIPMDEHHPTLPMSTYAVAKLAADRLAFTLHHEHNVPVIILRQFNTYGVRATQPYIIPELITQLSKGNKLNLGNLKATRDFTYVEDSAKAAVQLIQCKEAEGEVVNVGYGAEFSVEELAHTVGELMGHKTLIINVDKERLRPIDVERLHANYFKMHKLTGWQPKINLKEGLQRTIDWFNENGKQWLWEKKFGKVEEIWHLSQRGKK